MSKDDKVKINQIPTGVVGLDEIMGGGLPEFSFNIIAGSPGCGKTTLAHQIAFANATTARPALYFTLLGEPALKMLRYQQQFDFFEQDALNNRIQFINLSQMVLDRDLDIVLNQITEAVERSNPSVIVIDSFRALLRRETVFGVEPSMRSFVERLALSLTTWQATTFLVGEYSEDDVRSNAVFTVADGIIWLYQDVERNSVVRKLHIVKLRGRASIPGLHTFRITNNGLHVFPRTLGQAGRQSSPGTRSRLSVGNHELDEMMGGGPLEGDSILVAGPSGTGKTVIASRFIQEGLERGEPGVIAIFEERPEEYCARARSFGWDFVQPEKEGKLRVVYFRPMDLSVDESMLEIIEAVKTIGAKRLVIDSITGFEMALAPAFRADFRESLYRMIGGLTGVGITILSTVEIEDSFATFPFSHYSVSFLTDDIIRMRYVEIGGQLRKVMTIIKMRGSNHSKDFREYIINDTGISIIDPGSTDYERLSTGTPVRSIEQRFEAPPEKKR